MYFSSKNNFFHGIMFHHFHDEKVYKKSQGSINQDDFYKLIKFVGRENILDADEFFKRYKEYRLKANNLCLTFDDCIRCHYDIALPVLEDLKIKSFFFLCSGTILSQAIVKRPSFSSAPLTFTSSAIVNDLANCL